jgi:hypothetical protein
MRSHKHVISYTYSFTSVKKCQEAKQRIKDAKSKMNQANVEVKDI